MTTWINSNSENIILNFAALDSLNCSLSADEPGMFVGLIKNNDPSRQFHGYVNKDDSKKKVISDVFKKGDLAFVSGT